MARKLTDIHECQPPGHPPVRLDRERAERIRRARGCLQSIENGRAYWRGSLWSRPRPGWPPKPPWGARWGCSLTRQSSEIRPLRGGEGKCDRLGSAPAVPEVEPASCAGYKRTCTKSDGHLNYVPAK